MNNNTNGDDIKFLVQNMSTEFGRSATLYTNDIGFLVEKRVTRV
jgi:hypothetical protein